MNFVRPFHIPIILGTVRKGRQSAHAARLMLEQIQRRSEVVSEIIDIADVRLSTDDAGEAIKDATISEKLALADALVIVSPEYNHSFPGLLKHFLDGYLKEYIHKAAGVVGVSAGPFGGTRGIQDLLPVLRELGLVTIFWDVNVRRAATTFDASGQLIDQTLINHIDRFLDELIWMARTLRHGRETIPIKP